MTKITVYFLLVTSAMYGCTNKPTADDTITDQHVYELVENWPQLSPGYILSQPTGIGIDSREHIFVFHRTGRKWTIPFPDSLISSNTILELDNETGKILNSWGANLFIMPHGLTVDKEDNIWVTDVALHQVFKFNRDGQLLMTLGVANVPGNDSLHFDRPTDVAVADDGSFYVSDGYGNSRIVRFSTEGKYLFNWGTPGSKVGEFNIPHGLTLDDKGNVYVADRQNNRIQVFDSTGGFLKLLNNNVSVAQLPAVTVDNVQKVFAVDLDLTANPDTTLIGSTVFKYNDADSIEFHFGATGKDERIESWFHDISIDKQGNIFVGDIHQMKVLKFKVKTKEKEKEEK